MIDLKRFYYVLLIIACSLHAQTIHFFGDSHSSFCFSNNGKLGSEVTNYYFNQDNIELLLPFSIHYMGARTMHAIGRDGLKLLDFKRFGVCENDIVVCVFGEIDVRCHIGKQRDKQNVECEKIVDVLVDNYLETIAKNKKNFQRLHCLVMSVVPPTNKCFNKDFPFYGSLDDRIQISKLLNSKLLLNSKKYGIYFFDIFDLVADENFTLQHKLSDRCVHVAFEHNYLVKNKLIKTILEKGLLS